MLAQPEEIYFNRFSLTMLYYTCTPSEIFRSDIVAGDFEITSRTQYLYKK